MEKSDGNIHFSCAVKPATLLLISLDGICKPDIDIHQNRK